MQKEYNVVQLNKTDLQLSIRWLFDQLRFFPDATIITSPIWFKLVVIRIYHWYHFFTTFCHLLCSFINFSNDLGVAILNKLKCAVWEMCHFALHKIRNSLCVNKKIRHQDFRASSSRNFPSISRREKKIYSGCFLSKCKMQIRSFYVRSEKSLKARAFAMKTLAISTDDDRYKKSRGSITVYRCTIILIRSVLIVITPIGRPRLSITSA